MNIRTLCENLLFLLWGQVGQVGQCHPAIIEKDGIMAQSRRR